MSRPHPGLTDITFHQAASDRAGFFIKADASPPDVLAENLIVLRQLALAQEVGVMEQDPTAEDQRELEERIAKTQMAGGVILLATFEPEANATTAFGYARVSHTPRGKICQVKEVRVARVRAHDFLPPVSEGDPEELAQGILAAQGFNELTRPEAAIALVDRARRLGKSWWLQVETIPSLEGPLAQLGLDRRPGRETKNIGGKRLPIVRLGGTTRRFVRHAVDGGQVQERLTPWVPERPTF